MQQSLLKQATLEQYTTLVQTPDYWPIYIACSTSRSCIAPSGTFYASHTRKFTVRICCARARLLNNVGFLPCFPAAQTQRSSVLLIHPKRRKLHTMTLTSILYEYGEDSDPGEPGGQKGLFDLQYGQSEPGISVLSTYRGDRGGPFPNLIVDLSPQSQLIALTYINGDIQYS